MCPDPTRWGREVVVQHPERALATGKPKEYRLRLDADGTCIVSPGVWEQLQRALTFTTLELFAVNAVDRPPAQRIGF